MHSDTNAGFRGRRDAADYQLMALERHDGARKHAGLDSLLRRKVPPQLVLEEYAKEGLSVSQRARDLGVSSKTYDRYLDEYKLPRHQRKYRRKFTDEELHRRIMEGQSYAQISEELRVHPDTVSKRANWMGLRAARPTEHRWVLSDQELGRLHVLGITSAEAAAEAEPRVSAQTILRGWRRIGLSPHFRGRRRNTPDAEYIRLNEDGLTISEIARMRGENYDTAAKHCRELGLEPNTRYGSRRHGAGGETLY